MSAMFNVYEDWENTHSPEGADRDEMSDVPENVNQGGSLGRCEWIPRVEKSRPFSPKMRFGPMKPWFVRIAVGLSALALWPTAEAGAQALDVTTGKMSNPYTNPAMNPFLNPYMTQVPTDRNSALFYFLAAQKQNGGIGSGQISGVHPRPT